MKKHFISVMAYILIFTLLLVSCGDTAPQTEGGNNTSAPGTASTAPQTTTEPEEVPDIPDPSELGFDGQELNVLVWKLAARNNTTDNDDFYDAEDEAMEGEAVYEAVKQRNNTIEEKYGITINTEVTSDNLATKYLNAYKSGDVKWDIIAPMMNDIPNLIINETLMELGNLDYLDITKTYWDQGVFEGLSIGGKNYILSGDISTMDEELNVCIAYNQTLGEECEIDPVSYVKNGNWTVDVMGELARAVTRDLDGGGVMDKNDQYGIGHSHTSAFILLHASGERFATLDSDGVPSITLNTPRVVELLEKLYTLYNDKTAVASIMGVDPIYPDWPDLNQSMVDGKICFRPANIYNLKQYLLMEDEFTVLPIPKLDADEDYSHLVLTNSCAGYCVPASTERTEFVSIMLEELAYYGRKIVEPAYYDSYVTARLTQNQTTADMFDIIFATKLYDIGYVFNWGGMLTAVNNSILNGNPASNIDSILSAAETAMGETYNSIINAIG